MKEYDMVRFGTFYDLTNQLNELAKEGWELVLTQREEAILCRDGRPDRTEIHEKITWATEEQILRGKVEAENESLRSAMWDCYALLPPERVKFVAKKTRSTLKEQS